METIDYRFIDKSTWGPGPWQAEPDKKQWTDPATGLPCLLRRSRDLGNLCGYVGVSEGHLCFGLDYDDVEADVHGGLTFACRCAEGDPEHGICHRPGPGEPDHVWWLGFDCGHFQDMMPAMTAFRGGRGLPSFPGEVYRDQAYVEAECARLAAQLAVMMAPAASPIRSDAA